MAINMPVQEGIITESDTFANEGISLAEKVAGYVVMFFDLEERGCGYDLAALSLSSDPVERSVAQDYLDFQAGSYADGFNSLSDEELTQRIAALTGFWEAIETTQRES